MRIVFIGIRQKQQKAVFRIQGPEASSRVRNARDAFPHALNRGIGKEVQSVMHFDVRFVRTAIGNILRFAQVLFDFTGFTLLFGKKCPVLHCG
jgi:hypothetical protein